MTLRHLIFTSVGVVLLVAGCGAPPTTNGGPVTNGSTPATSSTPTPTTTAPGPTALTIPAIDVEAALIHTAMNMDGTLQVPPVDQPGQPSWYDGSPEPGEVGPSVLLGHIDGGGRDGVFHDLTELEPGDEIRVERADRSVAVFSVDRIERYDKDSFDTGAVYGNVPDAQIRAITCGGSYDQEVGSYTENHVAFGSLVAIYPVNE